MSKKLRALGGDVFAGLFTVGIKQAGYEVLGHLEHSSYGVKTAILNHPELDGRVWQHPSLWPDPKSFGKVDFMFTNPACAAWSNARAAAKGSWVEHTERLHAIDHLATYALDLQPAAWVWESVTNSYRHGRGFLDRIAQAFLNAGYSFTIIKENNKYLGVPQDRPRVLYTAHRHPLVFPKLQEPITVRQALRGLKPTKAELEDAQLGDPAWAQVWAEAAGHGKMRRAYMGMNDADREKVRRTPGFFSRRVMPDVPSPVNLDRANQLHPFEPRMFTWREQLRLCGLPENFQGAGGNNGSDFITLSRAVMPPVGKWLGEAVRDGLSRPRIRKPRFSVIHLDGGPEKVYEEELLPAPDYQVHGDLVRWDSVPPLPVKEKKK